MFITASFATYENPSRRDRASATGWSDPVPGRGLFPLWTSAFSRRTCNRDVATVNAQEAEDSRARKTNVLRRIYRSVRAAANGWWRREHLAIDSNLCICDTPKEIKTELRFRRMLDPWITFRHTSPACARK